MDRSNVPLIIVSLMFLSILAVTIQSTGDAAVDGTQVGSPPTRMIYNEAEGNNNWASANLLPSTSGSSYELHGNLSSQSDSDFFYFTLIGGSASVDRIDINPVFINGSNSFDEFTIMMFGFYNEEPLTHSSHSTSEEYILHSEYIQEYSWTWENSFIVASYTGEYGLRIDGNVMEGALEYNFTVRISTVPTPTDPWNDKGSSREISGSNTFSTTLDLDEDWMDWYHSTNPDPIHPLVMDMDLSILPNIAGTNARLTDTSGRTYQFGIDMHIELAFNSRNNPNNFNHAKYRISTTTEFQTRGSSPSPFKLKFERNCTEIYVGTFIEVFGVWTTNPVSSPKVTYQDSYHEGQVTCNYNRLDFYPKIPNKRPQLLNARVEPSVGKSRDSFKFYVTYRDPQNETPEQINLWRDGDFFKTMTRSADAGFDYSAGVLYETDVTGSQIGPDGSYKFNISATDGKDWAVDPESGIKAFYARVDNNLPPQSDEGEYKVIEAVEDPDPIWIILDNYFTDPDLTEFTYSIYDEEKKYYVEEVKIDKYYTVKIENNGTEVQPEWRLLMDIYKNVNGQIPIIINATDKGVFPKSVELTFIFDIEPVNDPPVLLRVGGRPTDDFKEVTFTHLEQGELEEISIIAFDIDDDILVFTWDIGDILAKNRRGTDYDFDPNTGELWFTTTDAEVPGIETTISVSDGNGGYDEVLVINDIQNINDPPSIIVPPFKSTIEGEYLYITPTYDDPDLDSGEIITFSYTMGNLERVTPSSAIEFSQVTGRLVIKAVSEDMNGEWEINITVVDFQGAADWGICKVTISNVNDPPVAYPINVQQEDENLTVTFHTLEAEDEDEDDSLIYIWDFGDGSGPVMGTDKRYVDHTFPTAGAYTITLTISDGQMSSEIREVILTVTAPPPNPDLDGDTMLNSWELKYGLDPRDPTDADIDLDDDGLTNLEEFDYYDDHGIYLNPWNPDSDGDGYDDGDEVNNRYDPLDPESHPDDPNKDLNLLLWLGALVLLVLFLLAAVLFLVLKIRNRPKPVAVPTGAIPTYQELPPMGYYEQMPPVEPASLPPAGEELGGDFYSGAGQELPATAPQELYQTQPGADQYGNYQDAYQQGYPQDAALQGPDQFGMEPVPQGGDEQFQSIPLVSTQESFAEQPSEVEAPMVLTGQEPPQLEQMDGSMGQPPPEETPDPQADITSQETEVIQPQEGPEVGQQIVEESEEIKEEGLPPPPDLPDV